MSISETRIAPPALALHDDAPQSASPCVEPLRASACANCGSEDIGKFCARCGQEQGPSIAPVGRMIGEIAEEIVKWDAKLWITLKGLCRPGFLTSEYLKGRRVRYIAPLRLYLFASFLYAVVLAVAPTGAVPQAPPRPAIMAPTAPRPALSASASLVVNAGTDAAKARRATLQPEISYAREIETAEQSLQRADQYGKLLARLKYLTPWLDANLSTVLVLTLPLNALVLHGLYRKQQPLYAGQFVTLLHAQSALFLLTTLALIVSSVTLPALVQLPLSFALHLGQPIYFLRTLRHVYGHLPGETSKRSLAKTVAYFALTKLPIHGLVVLLDVLNGWFHP